MSPPRVPPGNVLTLILPPLFSLRISANFWAPSPWGCSFAFWNANLMVRDLMSAAWAAPASSISPVTTNPVWISFKPLLTIFLRLNLVVASAGEPAGGHGDESREQDQQQQHDELGHHERPDTLDDIFHADLRHPGDDVEHGADRRRDQAD